MERFTRVEIAVGTFVALGLVALAYLAVSLGELRLWRAERYTVTARFASVGDLKPGAAVKLAGVRIGEVGNIRLRDYVAEVQLHLQPGVPLPDDTIASIRTSGLLGEQYVSLEPGGEEDYLKDGDAIKLSQSAVVLEKVIGQFLYDKAAGDK